MKKNIKIVEEKINDERVTVVMSASQRSAIEKIAKKIQNNGIKKKRITANSVYRAAIDLFIALEKNNLDASKVNSEWDIDGLIFDRFVNLTKLEKTLFDYFKTR